MHRINVAKHKYINQRRKAETVLRARTEQHVHTSFNKEIIPDNVSLGRKQVHIQRKWRQLK